MTQELVLFVGGPWDGERVLVDERWDVYDVASAAEECSYSLVDGPEPYNETIQNARYTRVRLGEPPGVNLSLFFFEEDRNLLQGPIRSLIDGYKRGESRINRRAGRK